MPGINKTVSAETPATLPLAGTELVRVVQSGNSAKCTVDDIAALGFQSPLTTKGDIAVFSTTTTRQSVGTDGQDLIADSTSATGLSWTSRFANFVASLASSAGAALVGFIQAGTGAVLRTLQSKSLDTVSACDFMTSAQIADVRSGALTLDVTAAINAATASLTKGGTVTFPAGYYLISGSLTNPDYGITFSGAGRSALWNGASSVTTGGSVIVKSASMTTDALLITGGGGFTMQNMAVIGQAGNTGDGITVRDSQNATFLNVSVASVGGNGWRIGAKSGTNGNSNQWQLTNCTSERNGGHGLDLYDQSTGGLAGDPNANGGTTIGFTASGNGGDGIHIENAQFNTFIGTVSQQNTGYGVNVVGTTANSIYATFVGGDYEANTAGNWNIGTNALHIVFVGSTPSAGIVAGNPNNFVTTFAEYNCSIRGLTFGGSVLNTYQTGTWTPNDQSGAGLTFTTSGTPTYTRVGNLVQIQAFITFPVTASTASAQIGGLPYASASGTFAQCSLATDVGFAINAYQAAGLSTFDIRTTALANVTNATLSGKRIVLTLSYQGA